MYIVCMCAQLDVTYQLRLRLYGETVNHRGAVIANTSNVINITVLANNFPFGLFSFPHANYSVTVGKVLHRVKYLGAPEAWCDASLSLAIQHNCLWFSSFYISKLRKVDKFDASNNV